MQFSTTVTQKGQITLPKKLRDVLSIDIYQKVIIMPAKDHLRVYPAPDLFELAGTFVPPTNTNVSPVVARKKMQKQYKRT